MAKNDWYVAYEPSTGIDGPMSQEDATHICETIDSSMMFTWNDLQNMFDKSTESDKSQALVVRGSIKSGVLELEEVSEGIEVDIRDYDVEGTDEDIIEEDENGSFVRV